MTKGDDDNLSVKKLSKKKLAKSCGKLIVISTMIIIVIGLLLITYRKNVSLSGTNKQKISNSKHKPAKVTNQVTSSEEWSLVNEVKKLEARQNRNIKYLQSETKDALADL
jgi:nitrate/TMAO reductase-like tetraheme cytochrome c subunit